jgi:hypothetical protein
MKPDLSALLTEGQSKIDSGLLSQSGRGAHEALFQAMLSYCKLMCKVKDQ